MLFHRFLATVAPTLISFLFITVFIGCAERVSRFPGDLPVEGLVPPSQTNRVALVTDLAPPQIQTIDLGATRAEGTLSSVGGAGLGTVHGFLSWESDVMGKCSGDFCGVGVVLLPIYLVGGAVEGAVSFSTPVYPTDTLTKAESNARSLLDSAVLQTQLLSLVQYYGHKYVEAEFVRVPSADRKTFPKIPNYTGLTNESIDVVLEIELSRLALQQSFEADARARLISVKTGTVLHEGKYSFMSGRHTLDEWMSDSASLLSDAIQHGLEALAEDIIDENFLLFYPVLPSDNIATQSTGEETNSEYSSRSKYVPIYVLSPVYPKVEICFACDSPLGNRPHRALGNREFVKVNSLRPTLRWERFPRYYDIIDGNGKNYTITDVQYDLRVYNAAPVSRYSLAPDQLIYDARDINEPYHQVQIDLNRCTDYFWTVRARFRIDGKTRVTEWAGAFDSPGPYYTPWKLRSGDNQYFWDVSGPKGPDWFYYPFMTPCH